MGVLEIPILETERLRLRAFRKSDLDSYLALHTDPEVMRYLVGVGPVPWDKGRCWRHIAFQLGHWQLEGSGVWPWSIGRRAPSSAWWALPSRRSGRDASCPGSWCGAGGETAMPPRARGPRWPMRSTSSGRATSSASSTRRTTPPSASPSASVRGWKGALNSAAGRCCAMASTGKAMRPGQGLADPTSWPGCPVAANRPPRPVEPWSG
jgi:hypothetical protein